LVDEITDDTLGHGPIEKLLADDSITEIMVNGPRDIWIERRGRLYQTGVRFSDEAHLRRIITKIAGQVGRRVDESSPMLDARLPDGSRVNALLPPLSLSGSLLTIRKFGRERYSLDDMVRLGTLTREAVELLQACLHAELNILISGGTGSGKTTLLNAMSGEIPNDERIVTIEDAAELRLNQRHVLRLESRPANIEGEGLITIRDLVRNALRMRPDRIVVGEVRGAEALDMLQAMNTGHDGSLSTVHANSARDALSRVETMVLMAGYDLPVRAIRQQLASALDLIVQLERLSDGTRRAVAITEVLRMEGDVITTQDLFTFDVSEVKDDGAVLAELRWSGLHPVFMPKLERRGVKLPASLMGPSQTVADLASRIGAR
jgi:pilus assembly protein CpaF